MDPKVEEYFTNAQKWKEELRILRSLVQLTGLDEQYKWRQPCYSINGKNVLIISAFKDYVALNFFKGSLLADNSKLLTKAGEHTQGGRQMRFKSVSEINQHHEAIRSYIFEAIEVEKSGINPENTSSKTPDIPNELLIAFNEDPNFKLAFDKLSQGRKRAYLIHFNGAKQSLTKSTRIRKMKNRILRGYGMNDCVCGLSKRMPNCDGSHKQIQ